jgi:hypothetical protein
MLTLNNFYGSSSGSGITWSVVSVNTTGSNNNGYIFDNSSSIHTLTLPVTPPVGATIGYKDLNGYFASFPLIVTGNGSKINGFAEDMVVDTNNAYGTLTYSGATQGWILTDASVGTPVVTKPLFHVQDQKPSGTAGGTSTAGIQTRVLNTILVNDIAGASLGSNQIILPAGTYEFDISAPMYGSSYAHKIRLYNVTDSIYLLEGSSEYNYNVTRSFIRGVVVLSTSKILRIDHYVVTGTATNGLGYPTSQGIEVYTDCKIYRLDANKQLVAGPQFSSVDTGKCLVVSGNNSQSYQNIQGRKNYIINGNFDVWQRGTTQSTSGYGSDDRWVNVNTGSTKVTSQQTFTLGQTDVPNNPKYFGRTVVTSVAGAGNSCYKYQSIEGVQTLSGQTVTLSFYAKADVVKNIAIEFQQSFGTGGSPSATVNGIGSQLIALTTLWKKYTVTVSIPSITGKTLGSSGTDSLQLILWFDAGSTYNSRTASLGQQSGTFDIAQVQLEVGSVATEFERRTFSDELILCKRYCQQTYNALFSGNVTSGSTYYSSALFPVTMRASVPTVFSSVNVSNSGFPATVGTIGVSSVGFQESRVANATAAGYFSSSIIFEAEL